MPTRWASAFVSWRRPPAPDVIMDSLTVSLGITVQAAPAVASDTPSWQNILLHALPAWP